MEIADVNIIWFDPYKLVRCLSILSEIDAVIIKSRKNFKRAFKDSSILSFHYF